jgi:hypothetical protein
LQRTGKRSLDDKAHVAGTEPQAAEPAGWPEGSQ